MTKTATARGILTDRDLEIAAWLERLGAVSVEQIRRRFQLGRTQAYRRLQVLQSFGLARRRHLLATHPPLYVGPKRSLRPGSVEHALAVAELILNVELQGGETATETELRRERAVWRANDHALDQPRRRLNESQLQTVRACARIPDAVEVRPCGALVAYEVELSSKGRSRRSSVLAAYASSDYERVVWIVPSSQLAALLRTEITDNGLDQFMEVIDEREDKD